MFFLKINDVIVEFVFHTKRDAVIYIVQLLERQEVENPVTVLKNADKTLNDDDEDPLVTDSDTYIIFKMDRHSNCCVCTQHIRERDRLKCGHSICIECLNSLRKNECPVCRTRMQGRLITDEVLMLIMSKEEADICEHEEHQQLLALLSMHGVDINEIYS